MPKVTEVLRTMDYGPAPESSTHVMSWLDQHKNGFGHFIDGEFAGSSGKQQFDALNPATGEVLARVAQGTERDVDAAVKAARKAFRTWSKLSGHDRARHLYAIARVIQKRERFLSVLESLDNGKAIRESRDIDIPLVARHFLSPCGLGRIDGFRI